VLRIKRNLFRWNLRDLRLQRESGELNNMIKGDKIKSEKVAQDYIDAGFFSLNGRHLTDDERSLSHYQTPDEGPSCSSMV
jgi:hypothetical protein